MKKLTFATVMIAMLAGVVSYGSAASGPQSEVVVSSSMSVSDLERTGDQLRVQKDYRGAIQCYRMALRKDENDAKLYNKMGLAALQNGDLGAALSDFQRSIKRNARYAQAMNNIGAVEFLQKRYGRAARTFKKAVALDETQATFHVNLGAAWFAQNKVEGAIAEYTRAMELDPDVLKNVSNSGISAQVSTPEERARYSYMLAKIYAKRSDLLGCLEFLRKAKEQGYRDMTNVYKEQEFAGLWQDPRLFEVVPAPVAK